MVSKSKLNEIRNLFGVSEFDGAFESLEKIVWELNNPSIKNEYLVRKANYKTYAAELTRGTVKNNEDLNKILFSLLQIIDNIETALALDIEKKNENEEVEKIQLDSLPELVRLLESETRSLDYRSTKEDLQRVDNLRRKLFDEIFGSFEKKVNFESGTKEKMVQVVFDKVYASEMLDNITKSDIYRIRQDREGRFWYERAAIVSALTLSLIGFKKFDPAKVSFLLDFISDFEDEVWERALVGLVLALLINPNKWQRFDTIKKRLQQLQTIENVQIGLSSIEFLLRNDMYKVNHFNKNIFNVEYFKESPFNFFLPFYKENKIIDHCISGSIADIDYDDLIENVSIMPYMDSYKYLLFIGLLDNTTKKIQLGNPDLSKFFLVMKDVRIFHPYYNLISEYYFFYKYYPAKYIDEFLGKQTSIYSTKLRDFILNKVNRLIFSADLYLREKNYFSAIQALEEANNIAPDRLDIAYNLGVCYMRNDRMSKAEKLFEKMAKNNPNDILAKKQLGICYLDNKKYDLAQDCFEYVYSKKPHSADNLIQYGLLKVEQKNRADALRLFKEAELITPEDVHLLELIGKTLYVEGQPEKAIEYYLKVKELGPTDKAENCLSLANAYAEANDYGMAIMYINKVIDIKPKDWYALMMRGRIMWQFKINIEEAKKDFIRALKISKSNIIYGNLAHLLLCEGKEQEAMEIYKECVLRFKDIEEFKEKFENDEKYIIRYNITSEHYNKVKCEMILYWELNPSLRK